MQYEQPSPETGRTYSAYMLRVSTTLGGNAIPRHLTTLSVSWLNGQFRAVSVRRGTVEAAWEHPEAVEEAGQFEALIREAVAQTNYRGQTVSLVLAHARLAQQLVDVPPAKDAVIHRIVQRQAQQQKLFPGEAAWTYQGSLPAKGTRRVVLHLFPKPLLDQLVQACRNNSLDLIAVVPVSAVLHFQLARLPLEKDEVTLLAAETGGATSVVVGRGDGQLLLVRTLPNNWNSSVDRLAVDLNRTLLFLSQQYGVTLNDVMWLFGPGAREQASALQDQMRLPVAVNPHEYEPFYWATEALKLKPGRTPNFLSRVLQQAPRRRTYARVVATCAALLFLAALATAAFSIGQARQASANIERLRQGVARFQTRRQQLQERNDRLADDQQLANVVLDGRPAPVPVWFLGYLGDVMPPDLAATYVHLATETNVWKLQMSTAWDASKPAPGPMPPEIPKALAELRTALSNGPFHLSLSSAGQKPGPGSEAYPLLIEGTIR